MKRENELKIELQLRDYQDANNNSTKLHQVICILKSRPTQDVARIGDFLQGQSIRNEYEAKPKILNKNDYVVEGIDVTYFKRHYYPNQCCTIIIVEHMPNL